MITAGESHGPGLTCIIEGLPAGLEASTSSSSTGTCPVASSVMAAGAG